MRTTWQDRKLKGGLEGSDEPPPSPALPEKVRAVEWYNIWAAYKEFLLALVLFIFNKKNNDRIFPLSLFSDCYQSQWATQATSHSQLFLDTENVDSNGSEPLKMGSFRPWLPSPLLYRRIALFQWNELKSTLSPKSVLSHIHNEIKSCPAICIYTAKSLAKSNSRNE